MKNYSIISLGKINEEKVFLKDKLGITGAEISFGGLPSNTSIPFSHKHKQNEEIYIILKGKADFKLDNDLIVVKEGDVLKVDPSVIRTINNRYEESFTYICIQVKQNSLEQYTATDAEIVE